LELNAELLELALISVDLARERLRFALQLFGALAGLVGTRRRRYEVQLEDLLTPHPMLPHHVLHDAADEGQGLVGLINGEYAIHELRSLQARAPQTYFLQSELVRRAFTTSTVLSSSA